MFPFGKDHEDNVRFIQIRSWIQCFILEMRFAREHKPLNFRKEYTEKEWLGLLDEYDSDFSVTGNIKSIIKDKVFVTSLPIPEEFLQPDQLTAIRDQLLDNLVMQNLEDLETLKSRCLSTETEKIIMFPADSDENLPLDEDSRYSTAFRKVMGVGSNSIVGGKLDQGLLLKNLTEMIEGARKKRSDRAANERVTTAAE